mgnify:CR=1 FL=1
MEQVLTKALAFVAVIALGYFFKEARLFLNRMTMNLLPK